MENISISYPAEFPLTGWEKEVFHYRLIGAFKCKYFSAYALDAARKAVFAEDDAKIEWNQTGKDLHVFEGMDPAKMPASLRAVLPAKVSEYVGVDVRWQAGPGLIAIVLRRIGLICAFVAGGALGAYVCAEWSAVNGVVDGTGIVRAQQPPLNALPAAAAEALVVEPLPVLRGDGEPVRRHDGALHAGEALFDVQLSTRSPANAVRNIASSIIVDDATGATRTDQLYSVTVTVVPAAAVVE